LVYQCKSRPSSRHCSQDGFEPGTSIGSGMQRVEHWKQAWSILGHCSGTITPTTAPAFVSLPFMGGCPEEWSSQSYEGGDHVSSMNLVFECNSMPNSLHCGQMGYEPATDIATPGAWKIAWTAVGSCGGTIEPTGSPSFDPINNVGPCPEEWAAGSDTKYEEGDIVSVTTSTTPVRKAAFRCREWPLSGFCGQFSPTNFGGDLGWIIMGSCDGTFAPTGAPVPYDGDCQYSKCELEEKTITNCSPGSSNCSCTSNQSAGVGCTKTVEELQCNSTDVEPWNSRINYVEGDVVRLGRARFRCREWPFFLWCRQFVYSPTLASDGIWNDAWIADGSCPPTQCESDDVSNMIIFGDSLVDVGNANNPLLSDACQQDGIFCGDRQSNGPLVAEFIADKLCIDVTASLDSPIATGGMGNNFAVSAARAGFDPDGNIFDTQVTSPQVGYLTFLAAAQQTVTPVVPPETLFFIWFGGNDVRDALAALANSEAEAGAVIAAAITAIRSNIVSLIAAGACSFLVLGTFNVALAPTVRLTAQAQGTALGLSGAGLQAFIATVIGAAEQFSRLFNMQLEAMLQGITIPDGEGCLGIKFVDTIPLVEDVFASDAYESKFGMFDPNPIVTNIVCNFRYNDPLTGNLLDPNGLPVLAEDEIDFECENFPFYDEIHPATDFYELVANTFLEEVDDFLNGSRTLLRRGL